MRGAGFSVSTIRRAVRQVVYLGAAGLLITSCSNTDRHAATAAAAPVCQDVTFPVYFAEWSDQLTDTAKQVLVTAARQVRGCKIAYVSVIGLTDAKGAPADNLELSKRRAQVVASTLQNAGLPQPKFEIRGLGELGSVTPHGKDVPMRRETEVAIHALPPG
jgi:outer membrane protein OmpA-like peptidoglycan-associated protein